MVPKGTPEGIASFLKAFLREAAFPEAPVVDRGGFWGGVFWRPLSPPPGATDFDQS